MMKEVKRKGVKLWVRESRKGTRKGKRQNEKVTERKKKSHDKIEGDYLNCEQQNRKEEVRYKEGRIKVDKEKDEKREKNGLSISHCSLTTDQ